MLVEYVSIKETRGELEAELRRANDEWQTGVDGGRDGVIHALKAVTVFLKGFDKFEKGNLCDALTILSIDLEALKDGNVSPLLAPPVSAFGGRIPAPLRRQATRGFAAGAMQKLMDLGTQRSPASEKVATAISEFNVSFKYGDKPLNGQTVKGWRDKAMHPKNDRVDADIYKHFVSRFQELPDDPQRAESLILDLLSGALKRLRPDA